MNGGALAGTALWGLSRNKPRTALTMLGIVIGVGSVVGMIGLGQGATDEIEAQVGAMGVNLLTILPGSKSLGGFRIGAGSVVTLLPVDARAILGECPSVALVSPGVRARVQAVHHNKNTSTVLQGASPEFLAIRGWDVDRGSFFDADHVRRLSKVCVLGETVARELFGDGDPTGQIVRLNHVPFHVLGVLVAKGQSSAGQDQDDIVVVPWTSGMRKVMGVNHLGVILASATSAALVARAQQEVQALLRRRHRISEGEEDDFTVQTQTEVIEAQTAASRFMMVLVVVIAGIALIVGGIGVMNIMLVTVIERTREIGIRMAVGARPAQVLWQFLAEAVALTSLGGLLGIALGLAVAAAAPAVLGWPARVTLLPVAGSFLFSSIVGVAFGFYPALRASRMDPVEALRYE